MNEKAEQVIKKSLADQARVELLEAGHYDDLEAEWHPEKEDKSVEELVEFAEGRIDGHWMALVEFCEVPWEQLIPEPFETHIEYNLRLLEMIRDGEFPLKSTEMEQNSRGENVG